MFASAIGQELRRMATSLLPRLRPSDGEHHAAEMALATTALGWPHGTFVLLPTQDGNPHATLERGLNRLRWLFEGELELRVFGEATVAASPVMDPARRWLRSAVRARASVRPARSCLVPRYPVVFCHGMLAFSMLKMSIPEDSNCFAPMREIMRERGFRVLFPQVSPTSGVTERAAQLHEQILSWTDEPVNIIAHSMGGLDALSHRHLDMARGSARSPPSARLITERTLPNGFWRTSIGACRSAGARVLWRKCGRFPPSGGVRRLQRHHAGPSRRRIFLLARRFPVRLSPILRRAWTILRTAEGENDGMVGTASAHWGQYLGTIAADHFAQTPDLVFVRPNEDFDVLGFYTRLVEDLARRGF